MYQNYILNWLETERSLQIKDREAFSKQNYLEQGDLDSFGFVQLIAEVEEHFKITFTEEDFDQEKIMTIAGLVEVIKEKQNL